MNETDLIQAINGIDDRYLFESEEPYKKFSRIRNPYGLIIIAVAILVFAVPAGAFTVRYFLHRDNVENYLSGAEEASQKQPDIVKNLVAENEDYRLTLDALLSDGHNAMIIITNEAISEKGQKHLKKSSFGSMSFVSPSFCIEYADGSDGPIHHSEGLDIDFPIVVTSYIYDYVKEAKTRNDARSASVVDCRDIDLSKEISLEMFLNDEWNDPHAYFGSRDPKLVKKIYGECDIANYLDGIQFTVNFVPNIPCNTLYDADGRQIFLSAFELYSNDSTVLPRHGLPDVTFIKDSGERIRFELKDHNVNASSDEDRAYFIFGEFIDPDEYAGVEVNGVEFWKK